MGRRRDTAGPASPRSARTPIALPQSLPTPYEAFSDSPNLIDTERGDLAACEAAIDNLRLAFWAAGKALQVIRDARLYRATHPTFEDYCEDRWQMNRTYAYRLIYAWPLAEALLPIGNTSLNEAQIRELLPVANRHGHQAAVTIYQTVADVDGVKVTASVLKEVISVLPADHFDAAEAIEQIRAYLAGQTPPQEPLAMTAAELWEVEASRVRTALRRIRRDTIRTAAAEHPDDARRLAAELRELADEVENGVQP